PKDARALIKITQGSRRAAPHRRSLGVNENRKRAMARKGAGAAGMIEGHRPVRCPHQESCIAALARPQRPGRLRRRERYRRAEEMDLITVRKSAPRHATASHPRPSLPWPTFASVVASGRSAMNAKARAMKATYDFDRI